MENGEPGALDLDAFLDNRIAHLGHVIATAKRTRALLRATRDAIQMATEPAHTGR